MPNRNLVGDYRYGYQGEFAETDPETGKVAFELRLYDPRINRWMAPDPAKQYPSPYMSMGNNWVSQVDPDGAKADDWYVNKSGELEWHQGSADLSSQGLTWVGTDTAPKDYLSSMSTLFGGSGDVPGFGSGIGGFFKNMWKSVTTEEGWLGIIRGSEAWSMNMDTNPNSTTNREKGAVQDAMIDSYAHAFNNFQDYPAYAYGYGTAAVGTTLLTRKLSTGYGLSAFGGRISGLYLNPSAKGITLFAIQNSSRLKNSTWHFRLDIHRVYSLENRRVLHYHSASRNGLSNRQWFKAVEHSATPLIKF